MALQGGTQFAIFNSEPAKQNAEQENKKLIL
jgi:hypothetical protein